MSGQLPPNKLGVFGLLISLIDDYSIHDSGHHLDIPDRVDSRREDVPAQDHHISELAARALYSFHLSNIFLSRLS